MATTEEQVSDYEGVLFARAMRLARSQSDAWDLVQDTYERALRDGRAVVMVHVHGDAPKVAAQRILKSHGGHFINYYGRFATEELDMWRGPEPEIPGYLRR
jgi:hypothetical protein